MARIYYINHNPAQCGVFQFGDRLGKAFSNYQKNHEFFYSNVSSTQQYLQELNSLVPDLVLFNYFPSTLPWINIELMNLTRNAGIKTLGITHEHHQVEFNQSLFDKIVVLDPTMETTDKIFVTKEGIPEYTPTFAPPSEITIGTFGFGFLHKGYGRLLEKVNEEFDEALIRLHIPWSTFGDSQGEQARDRVKEAQAFPSKPGIRIEAGHQYFADEDLLNWLAGNTLNAFLFDDRQGIGVSGSIWWALAVKRPIAVTDTGMFRHIPAPEIRIENNSLKEIIALGTKPLEQYYGWTMKSVVKDYENFIDRTLENG